MIVENGTLVRTVNSYEANMLKGNFGATGIKEKYVFHNIKNLHIAQNFADDACEGVVVYTDGEELQKFIKDKTFFLWM